MTEMRMTTAESDAAAVIAGPMPALRQDLGALSRIPSITPAG